MAKAQTSELQPVSIEAARAKDKLHTAKHEVVQIRHCVKDSRQLLKAARNAFSISSSRVVHDVHVEGGGEEIMKIVDANDNATQYQPAQPSKDARTHTPRVCAREELEDH